MGARRAASGLKAQQADETRQRLLDAAGRVFVETSVASATLEAIVRSAGLTRGALYWHFDGKSSLLQALLQSRRLPLEQLAPEDMRRAPAPTLARAVAETVSDARHRELCQLLVRNPDVPEVRERILLARCRLQRAIQRALGTRQAAARHLGWPVRACVIGTLAEWLELPPPAGVDVDGLAAVLEQALGVSRQPDAPHPSPCGVVQEDGMRPSSVLPPPCAHWAGRYCGKR
ncbi:TetR family transcriptional regulator [Rubrivivax gelatinosus]|uniref:Transcriptional regulator, TetR family n=1 Tax=Rubrivivax gelatinosus (strain NBRC 100245 / IL144) TaxID=983917 RepID=I0HPQ2_RUBGI|nr:TetR family transcriptional regulator [Rubrivivax gelatinosus]BAL94989.1 transcriptional regulator, TetR family [Rubrivivax gelatinosus IL144]